MMLTVAVITIVLLLALVAGFALALKDSSDLAERYRLSLHHTRNVNSELLKEVCELNATVDKQHESVLAATRMILKLASMASTTSVSLPSFPQSKGNA